MNSVDVSSLMSVFSHGHDFVLIKLFWLVASFSLCVYIVCVCVLACNVCPSLLWHFEKARCNICSHPPIVQCSPCRQCRNVELWHHAILGFSYCI